MTTVQPCFETPVRVHEALTARLERRILHWLAARLPARVHSDHLTALALAAQLAAGASYAVHLPNLASIFIALNWFGDSLDGTVARIRNCQRPRYGYYVDHVVDCFGALALMAGIVAGGYAHVWAAAALLIGFYLLSIETYLAATALGRFQMAQAYFGPTELRILLCIANAFLKPGSPLFDVGAMFAAPATLLIAIASASRNTARLYREERLP